MEHFLRVNSSFQTGVIDVKKAIKTRRRYNILFSQGLVVFDSQREFAEFQIYG